MPTPRSFGIEIECMGPDRETVAKAIRQARYVCMYPVLDSETHVDSSVHWKIVEDGSITPSGFEVVSPILKGDNGLIEAGRVIEILQSLGAAVNNSCGLHVHVDARGKTVNDLVYLTERYETHEAEIDALVRYERRGDGNSYCQSAKTMMTQLKEFVWNIHQDNDRLEDMSLSTFGDELDEVLNNGRYYKINFIALMKHGTIEFRHHHGSVNPEHITDWVRFCVNLVETSNCSEVQVTETTPSVDIIKLCSERSILYILYRTSWDACKTRADVAINAGIPEGEVKEFIKTMNEKYSVSIKYRKGFGYYRRSDQGNFSRVVTMISEALKESALSKKLVKCVPVTPETNGIFSGLPEDLVERFSQKKLELSRLS